MHDLNKTRFNGETRSEYAKRIKKFGIDSTEITKLLEKLNYSKHIKDKDLNYKIPKIPFIKKVISFLNPSSIIKFRGF